MRLIANQPELINRKMFKGLSISTFISRAKSLFNVIFKLFTCYFHSSSSLRGKLTLGPDNPVLYTVLGRAHRIITQ